MGANPSDCTRSPPPNARDPPQYSSGGVKLFACKARGDQNGRGCGQCPVKEEESGSGGGGGRRSHESCPVTMLEKRDASSWSVSRVTTVTFGAMLVLATALLSSLCLGGLHVVPHSSAVIFLLVLASCGPPSVLAVPVVCASVAWNFHGCTGAVVVGFLSVVGLSAMTFTQVHLFGQDEKGGSRRTRMMPTAAAQTVYKVIRLPSQFGMNMLWTLPDCLTLIPRAAFIVLFEIVAMVHSFTTERLCSVLPPVSFLYTPYDTLSDSHAPTLRSSSSFYPARRRQAANTTSSLLTACLCCSSAGSTAARASGKSGCAISDRSATSGL